MVHGFNQAVFKVFLSKLSKRIIDVLWEKIAALIEFLWQKSETTAHKIMTTCWPVFLMVTKDVAV